MACLRASLSRLRRRDVARRRQCRGSRMPRSASRPARCLLLSLRHVQEPKILGGRRARRRSGSRRSPITSPVSAVMLRRRLSLGGRRRVAKSGVEALPLGRRFEATSLEAARARGRRLTSFHASTLRQALTRRQQYHGEVTPLTYFSR